MEEDTRPVLLLDTERPCTAEALRNVLGILMPRWEFLSIWEEGKNYKRLEKRAMRRGSDIAEWWEKQRTKHRNGELLPGVTAVLLQVRKTSARPLEWIPHPYRKECPAGKGVKEWADHMRPILYVDVGELPKSGAAPFLDSSIWHRYIPLDRLTSRFEVFSDVLRWHRWKLYSRRVALEYLDYAIRELGSQHLVDMSDHWRHVSLHSFHSESEATRVADDEMTELRSLTSSQPLSGSNAKGESDICLPWRLLILDDYAGSPLAGLEDSAGLRPPPTHATCRRTGYAPSKGFLVYYALNGKCEPERESIGTTFPCTECPDFTCVSSLVEAKRLLSSPARMHDMILVDYLLAVESVDGASQRQKGTSLISWLNRSGSDEGSGRDGDLNPDRNRGPAGAYWCFPMSAFPGVFATEMSKGGIETVGEGCFVSAGADPVCTPELFRWQLLRFMRRQLSYFHQITGGIEDGFSLRSLSQSDGKDPEEFWREAHRHITQHKGSIVTLLRDCQNGSRTVKQHMKGCCFSMAPEVFQSIFPYLENYLRLRGWHMSHAREVMLQDLAFIENEARKVSGEGGGESVALREWVRKQRSGLLMQA